MPLSPEVQTSTIQPTILPRERHPISRRLVSDHALKVLHRLNDAGYAALLVGGCVRDLMLGREPKDFDVVTNARPEEIRKLFHNARLIGRRFRLAHVRFGREVIEVTTFRALPRAADGDGEGADSDGDLLKSREGRLLRDNVFGTQAEDAIRRDFTVNALYYNIVDRGVMDYVGGVDDLRTGTIRVIGDASIRYREDPVRMLRAVRFAATLGFRIEHETAAPIRASAPLLADVPPARMFEEVLKLYHGGHASKTNDLLHDYGLLGYLFPLTAEVLAEEQGAGPAATLLSRALASTDTRVNEGKPVTPAFLFAAMLWEPMRRRMQAELGHGRAQPEALALAADAVIAEQLKRVAIPRRFSVPMREIWEMQQRLEHRQGSRALRLLEHPRFRAAYDFLLLRADAGSADAGLAQWWTQFQQMDDGGRKQMSAALAPAPGGKGRGRRRRRRGGRGHANPAPPVLG